MCLRTFNLYTSLIIGRGKHHSPCLDVFKGFIWGPCQKNICPPQVLYLLHSPVSAILCSITEIKSCPGINRESLSLVWIIYQSQASGGSSSWCRTHGLRSTIWGSDPSLLGRNLCGCNYPVCGSPTQGCGSQLTAILPLLPISLWFLLYNFSWRWSFLLDQQLLCKYLWFWCAYKWRWAQGFPTLPSQLRSSRILDKVCIQKSSRRHKLGIHQHINVIQIMRLDKIT